MSGEKRQYVRVEDRELRRLREQDSRLRSLQQDLPERLQAVREQARREFQQRLAPLEERARRQERETQRLKTGLRDLERETTKQLQQQRQEYLQIAREQRQEYTQLIASERQARVQGQQVLQQQIDRLISDIQQDERRKAQLAQDLLSDLEEIWSSIDINYQHQRFAPGRLTALRRELELARNNIQGGVPESAIAISQRTYLDLVDLRLELEEKEQEWLLFYNAAAEDLRCLIAEVQANRECELEMGQGDEAETFRLEVDYWVNGSLTEYEQQLSQLESQLKAGEQTLSTSQLQELGAEITSLQPKLGEIVEQAKLAILGSQLRAEIADRVAEVLYSLGYDLVNPESNSIYEGDDQRNAYVVKVKNIAGDEVVTVISPEKEFGANSISINTFSQTLVDEKATDQNARAIFDILKSEGVEGSGKMECNEARTEYQDMQQVKQGQKVTGQTK